MPPRKTRFYRFRVVSHYTEHTPYALEVLNLTASLDALHLPYEIVPCDDLGDWQRNVHQKSRVIAEQLDRTKLPLLYVDADAVVRQYPALADDPPADVCAHVLEGREIQPETLILRNTDGVRQFVDRWHDETVRSPEQSERRLFARTLRKAVNEGLVTFADLPASYCRIFDRKSMAGVEPVIEHFQASRRFKKLVTRGRQHG
jgi:hypothetical protein